MPANGMGCSAPAERHATARHASAARHYPNFTSCRVTRPSVASALPGTHRRRALLLRALAAINNKTGRMTMVYVAHFALGILVPAGVSIAAHVAISFIVGDYTNEM